MPAPEDGAGTVAFDLEGTLSTGETWKGIGNYLREHGRVGAYQAFFWTRVPEALLARAGIIDERGFKRRWVEALPRLFAGYSEAEFARVAEWVVEHELWPGRRDDVLAELVAHRRAGRQVILVSGTYQPVLERFAARLGAQALGTPLEVSGGKLTGRLAQPVNLGAVKTERLGALLAGERLHAAYGDTGPDLHMLELADEPVAVYPDAELRSYAQRRGWRLLEG